MGHEIFLRNGIEKTRSALDCGSSKSIGAEEDDERKKEKDDSDNWMKELDSEVAGSSEDPQQIQPK